MAFFINSTVISDGTIRPADMAELMTSANRDEDPTFDRSARRRSPADR